MSSSRMRTSVLKVVHDEDPKTVILKGTAAAIKQVHPTGKNVVFVVYERARKSKKGGETVTAGNIIIPETASAISEDEYQGNVGLVVAVGPNVKDLGPVLGRVPKVGDWITYRIQDASAFTLAPDFPARRLEGQMIQEFIEDPDVVM